jgi:hypothetical protein
MAIKPEVKENFRMAAMLLFSILQQKQQDRRRRHTATLSQKSITIHQLRT